MAIMLVDHYFQNSFSFSFFHGTAVLLKKFTMRKLFVAHKNLWVHSFRDHVVRCKTALTASQAVSEDGIHYNFIFILCLSFS